MKLIATKNMTYKTRHLVAGEPFEVPDRLARILIGIRRAKAAETRQPRKPRPTPAPPAETPEPESTNVGAMTLTPPDDDEINQLRKAARRLGIVVDRRWGRQRLLDQIAQVRGA